MRVFVTGATGFVGSAVVAELISAGHQVLGLSRTPAGDASLRAAGAEAQRGSLEQLESLKVGVASADAVAHLAFNHDFSRFAENGAADRRAILAMGEVLGSRPLLVTSGVALMTEGRTATEADQPVGDFPRQSEQAAAELAARGARASAVRLPPTTHGRGDHGFVPRLIDIAREKGVAAYVGDGANRWPAGHRLDAAKVFRLALERGAEGGPFHAIAEEGVPFKAIAEAIGRGLGLPAVSIAPEEAMAHFGFLGAFAGRDMAASSARTRARLGWSPTQPGLLEDLQTGGYFER